MTKPEIPFILAHHDKRHGELAELRDADLEHVAGGSHERSIGGTTCGTTVVTPDGDSHDTSGDSDD